MIVKTFKSCSEILVHPPRCLSATPRPFRALREVHNKLVSQIAIYGNMGFKIYYMVYVLNPQWDVPSFISLKVQYNLHITKQK